MATMKTIKLRTRSVQNIQKITQTMKMVSAAKYARAERELKAIRPFGIGALQFVDKTKVVPIKSIPEKKMYIAITSDRGLCGACHTSIARHVRNSLIENDKNTRVVCVGNKSRLILQRIYRELFLVTASEVGRIPPIFLDASVIANEILKSDYDFTEGIIVYNKFRNVVSYKLDRMLFYGAKIIENSEKMPIFDSIDRDVIQNHLEFNIAALIFYAMKESSCSEQSSRMTAMDNATKNAGDMIDSLKLKYNRTRQAVITNELIEIISGASALQTKD